MYIQIVAKYSHYKNDHSSPVLFVDMTCLLDINNSLFPTSIVKIHHFKIKIKVCVMATFKHVYIWSIYIIQFLQALKEPTCVRPSAWYLYWPGGYSLFNVNLSKGTSIHLSVELVSHVACTSLAFICRSLIAAKSSSQVLNAEFFTTSNEVNFDEGILFVTVAGI